MTPNPIPTSTVAQDGRADHRTIGAAIAASPSGGRVVIRPGTYHEQLSVDHDVELIADGPIGSVRVLAPSACLAVGGGSVLARGVTFWQGQPKPGAMSRLVGRTGVPGPVLPQKLEPTVAAVQVRAGLVTLEDCSISAATGLAIGATGPDARIVVLRTRIHRVTGGVAVVTGATALIDSCDFSEWALDAIWASRPASRVEVRGCTFRDSAGQSIYVDKAATAIVEGCEFADVSVAVFAADPDTETLVRSNTVVRCANAGVMIRGGAHVVVDGTAIGSSKVGILAVDAATLVDVSGGRLDGNETGIGLADQAQLTATGVEILGGGDGGRVGGRGSRLELRACLIRGGIEAGALVKEGATLVIEGGEISQSQIGVLGLDAGSDVVVRSVSVHGHGGPGISIGAGVIATLDGNEVFDNAFPGIVTVGGRIKVLDNRVHDNRSNGIAIRGAAAAVVEGNEVWGNTLPSITVVGAGSHAVVKDNTVRDNAGQGIYVYEAASAEIIKNRLTGNGRAAITISDAGASATLDRNVIEASGGPGIWVADGATATLDGNEITGSPEAGICVNDGARVEAFRNNVRATSVGVVVQAAGGSFRENQLVGNRAGSWCLIDAGPLTRSDNSGDQLPLPGWAASYLDGGRYVLLALRVGAELGIPPSDVERLGSSLSLPALAERLATEPIGRYGEVIRAHLAVEQTAHGSAESAANAGGDDPASVRAALVAHLAGLAEVTDGMHSRSTALAGIVEVLAVQGADGAGAPLRDAETLGRLDELFALGEANIRRSLQVRELPVDLLGQRAFDISGCYSGSIAVLHLAEWCPQVVGSFGTLVAIGDAEHLTAVPVEDSAIVYALPGLIGNAVAAWLSAAWKLGPRLAWVSTDRIDAFAMDVSSAGTVLAVHAPAGLARLLARLPEPHDRIPVGWESELRMAPETAARVLSVVRMELLARLGSDASQLPEITPRSLIDIGGLCAQTPPESWPGRVTAFFDGLVEARRVLDHLSNDAGYEEVRPNLWIQLDRNGTRNTVERSAGPDLTATLVISSGPRKRRVSRPLAARWGVPEAQLWEDAESNMLASDIVATQVTGPVVRLETRDHEGEAIGLLLDRRSGACARGYLVGLVHKGAALVVEIPADSAVDLVPPFAVILAGIYAEASKFNDQLSSHVYWSRPDGALVALLDVTADPPNGRLPKEFLVETQHLA